MRFGRFEEFLKRQPTLFIILTGFAGFSLFLFLKSWLGYVGFVTFEPTFTNGTTFHSPTVNLTCSVTASSDLKNITATITDDIGQSRSQTAVASGISQATTFTFDNVRNGEHRFQCSACTASNCSAGKNYTFYDYYNITHPIGAPILNITFDDETIPWEDYSILNHELTEHGSIGWLDRTKCKWYGCANMSATSGDYLEGVSRADLSSGMAVSFWVKHDRQPTGDSMMYLQFGNGATPTDSDVKYLEDAGWGVSTHWQAQNGTVSAGAGSSNRPAAGEWYHYFLQYNPSTCLVQVYVNGELLSNQSECYGNLTSSVGEQLLVGRAIYGIDLEGFMDELLVWNRGNFTPQQVRALFDSQRAGTPPELDLYVKSVTYELPYNWGSSTNDIDLSGSMDINITVANAGQQDAPSSFAVKLYIDSALVCSYTTTLKAEEEDTHTCSWPKSAGWHSGYVLVDADNNIDETAYAGGSEDNNKYYVYIPMESHPRVRFSMAEWDSNILPYASDSSHKISYDAYHWFQTFVSSDFNPAYTASSVDPYAKKGFENALGCFINNYQNSEQCKRARNHLKGWLNDTTGYEDASVQALHEIVHIGTAYDLMFPNLTKDEAELYAKKLTELCLEVYGKDNVRPDTDSGEPAIDNGMGFSSGMAVACYSVIGDYPENPNVVWTGQQSYAGKSTVYWWTKRIENFLKGFKDDPYAFYPEGMSYKWYSEYHLIDALWFLKRTGISTVTETYQNAICAMTRETAAYMLDHTYNGNTLRNDKDRTFRQVTFGDTYSYDEVGSNGINGWDVVSAFGLLCNDNDVKKAARYLRRLAYDIGEETITPGGLYYYSLLAQEVPLISNVGDVMPSFMFSKSFDRITLRRGYTYENDTLFIIDSGDEAQGGHSNAEFTLFSYVFGEPFLDYPQVPYNDDVRSEVWHNTISFSNDTSVPGWNSDPYSAVLHQYYGGKDIEGSYPDFYFKPTGYRGDLNDVIGTEDGRYAAVRAWKPYKTATEPVTREFVLFDNLLVHLDIVKRNTNGNIYANWINIYDEFSPQIQGNELILTRGDKHYFIDALWSSAGQINLEGGDSGRQYCFYKTSCSPGGKGNYARYYHYVSGQQATTLFLHHWYRGSDGYAIQEYVGVDRGVNATYNGESTLIILDTNEDGTIDEVGYFTDGWSIAARRDITASAGTTLLRKNGETLFESNNKASVYMDYNDITTINATVYLEKDTTFNISLDGASDVAVYENGQPLSSSDYTISNGKIQMTRSAGSYAFVMIKGGDIAPVVNLQSPEDGASSNGTVTFNCSAADDNIVSKLSLFITLNGTFQETDSVFGSGTTATLEVTKTGLSNGTYTWNCQATDNASQSGWGANRTFSVDTSPPAIYSDTLTAEAITNQSATITWQTDKDSTSKVYYGASLLENINSVSGMAVSHEVPVGELHSNTTYFYIAESCNQYGCTNSTKRNFTTLATYTDTSSPLIAFAPPTPDNGSSTSETTITINFTCSDDNPESAKLEWDGSWENVVFKDGEQFWQVKESVSEGQHTFRAWCNDSYANSNYSETRTFSVVASSPSKSYVCGDGICDEAYESCSTCEADCGSCRRSSGGGGGGGSPPDDWDPSAGNDAGADSLDSVSSDNQKEVEADVESPSKTEESRSELERSGKRGRPSSRARSGSAESGESQAAQNSLAASGTSQETGEGIRADVEEPSRIRGYLSENTNLIYILLAGILVGAGVFVLLTRFIVPEIDRQERERLENESYEINRFLDIIHNSRNGIDIVRAANRMNRPLKEIREIADFLEGEGIVEELDGAVVLTEYGRKIREQNSNLNTSQSKEV